MTTTTRAIVGGGQVAYVVDDNTTTSARSFAYFTGTGGGAALTIDAKTVSEWAAQLVSDRFVSMELTASFVLSPQDVTEWLRASKLDVNGVIEWSADNPGSPIFSDRNAIAEGLLSVTNVLGGGVTLIWGVAPVISAITSDAQAQAEWMTTKAIAANAGASVEWQHLSANAVLSDVQAQVEWSKATVTLDAEAQTEWLGTGVTTLGTKFTTYNLDATTVATPRLMTWRGFAPGDVPPGSTPTLQAYSGGPLVSNLTMTQPRYLPSGDLEHALFAWDDTITYSPNGSGTYSKDWKWGSAVGSPLTGSPSGRAAALANILAGPDVVENQWDPPYDFTYTRTPDWTISLQYILNNFNQWDSSKAVTAGGGWAANPLGGWRWISDGLVHGICAWMHDRNQVGLYSRTSRTTFYVYWFGDGGTPPLNVYVKHDMYRALGPNPAANTGTSDVYGEKRSPHTQLKYGSTVVRHCGGPFDECGNYVLNLGTQFAQAQQKFDLTAGPTWMMAGMPVCIVPNTGATIPTGMDTTQTYWLCDITPGGNGIAPGYNRHFWMLLANGFCDYSPNGVVGIRAFGDNTTYTTGAQVKPWTAGETGITGSPSNYYQTGTCYRFANGSIYAARSAGTAGVTAPTGGGIVSDGNINWERIGITAQSSGSGTVTICPSTHIHPTRGWIYGSADGQPIWIDGGTGKPRARFSYAHDLEDLWNCGATHIYSKQVAATLPKRTNTWMGRGTLHGKDYAVSTCGMPPPYAITNGGEYWVDQGGEEPGEDRVGFNCSDHVWWLMRPDDPLLDQFGRTIALNSCHVIPSFWDETTGCPLNLLGTTPSSVGPCPDLNYKGALYTATTTGSNPVTPVKTLDPWRSTALWPNYQNVYSGSHTHEAHLIPYIIGGGHQLFLDEMLSHFMAPYVGMYATNNDRLHTIGSNHWTGIFGKLDDQQLRSHAWTIRWISNFEFLAPDGHYQRPYAKALMDNMDGYLSDFLANYQPSRFAALGMWPPVTGTVTTLSTGNTDGGGGRRYFGVAASSGAHNSYAQVNLLGVYWTGVMILNAQREKNRGQQRPSFEQWAAYHERYWVGIFDDTLPNNANASYYLTDHGQPMAPVDDTLSSDPVTGVTCATHTYQAWGDRMAGSFADSASPFVTPVAIGNDYPPPSTGFSANVYLKGTYFPWDSTSDGQQNVFMVTMYRARGATNAKRVHQAILARINAGTSVTNGVRWYGNGTSDIWCGVNGPMPKATVLAFPPWAGGVPTGM